MDSYVATPTQGTGQGTGNGESQRNRKAQALTALLSATALGVFLEGCGGATTAAAAGGGPSGTNADLTNADLTNPEVIPPTDLPPLEISVCEPPHLSSFLATAEAEAFTGHVDVNTVSYENAVDPVGVSLQASHLNYGSFAEGDRYEGIANLIGSDYSDKFLGDAADNRFEGGAGDDELYGFAGADRLEGGAGDDRLEGGRGNDVLMGGVGMDAYVFEGGFGHDIIEGDADGGSLYFNDVVGIDDFVFEHHNGDLKIIVGDDSVMIQPFDHSGSQYFLYDANGDLLQTLSFTARVGTEVTDETLTDETEATDETEVTEVTDLTLTGLILPDKTLTGEILPIEDDDRLFGGDDILDGDETDETEATDETEVTEVTDLTLTGLILPDKTLTGEILPIEDDDRLFGDGIYDFIIDLSGDETEATDETEVTEVTDETLTDLTLTGLILPDKTLTGEILPIEDDDRLFGGDDMLDVDEVDGDNGRRGTEGDDYFRFYHGDQTAFGLAGNDHIEGGHGEDKLYGGVGNDHLEGGHGEDQLYGGEGADELLGDHGNDQLYGGVGNDHLEGGRGDDIIRGGDGDDHLYGGGGEDTLYGGAGDDSLNDGRGDNTYVFAVGDGTDTISKAKRGGLYLKPDTATLRFEGDAYSAEDFAPSRGTFTRVGNDLEITLDKDPDDGIEDKVTIENAYDSDPDTRTGNSAFTISIEYGSDGAFTEVSNDFWHLL